VRGFAWMLAALLTATACRAELSAAYRGADATLLAQVRTGFETAPDSAPETARLIRLLEASLPAEAAAWPPVFRAYRAALEGLAGKHSATPWTKYNRAREAIARWAGLVEAHPDSIEIRMLRCSFASQLPDFFGLGPQAAADLDVLAGLLERAADPFTPADYRRDAIRWILRHGAPGPAPRRRLEAALSALEPPLSAP
jgi:hypothetical protein